MFLTICPICQCHFHHEDQVNSTTCGHVYHKECITGWLDQSSSCPICHHSVQRSELIRLYMDNHKMSSTSVGVDISNRQGVFLRFLVRDGDTVGSLVKELLDSREVDRIYDVLLNGKSVLHGFGLDYNSLLIRDCGVVEGDTLHLVEVPIIRFSVTCVQPLTSSCQWVLNFRFDEDANQIRCRFADKMKCSPESIGFLYTSGGIISTQGNQKRYIRIFDEKAAVERLVNVDSQETISSADLNYYVRTILYANSSLPDFPGHTLSVRAHVRVEYWKLVSTELSSPFIRLSDLPNLLQDPSICAWFSAYACLGPTGEQRFFLRCYSDYYVDCKTGERFYQLKSLSKALPCADFRYCVIVVNEGVQFPKFCFIGCRLMLWTPAGLKLFEEHGRLRKCPGSIQSEPNTWYAGRRLSDHLEEYFKNSTKSRTKRKSVRLNEI